MPYSVGKYAYGICDKTGFRYPLKELIPEIRNGAKTGMMVGYDVADADHPQNHLGKFKIDDTQSLLNARPDRIEPATERLLLIDPFTTAAAGGGNTVVTVTEKDHGRSTSDTVRFRNSVGFDGLTAANFNLATGYAITKLTDDTYTVTIAASSTTGSIKGGGVHVTVGPVTLEA